MPRLIILVALALSIAGGAQAQNTRTTCGWQSGLWVCDTQQPRPGIKLFSTDGIIDRGNEAFKRSYDQMEAMRADRARMQAQRLEQEQAQQREQELVPDDADARFLARQNAREAAEARTRSEIQTATADQRLATERQKLEAIDIVKRYIAAGHCDDARRVAYEFFGTKGAQDATELCPG